MTSTYPDLIRDLPEADLRLPGVRGWLLQGATRQAVFFELPPGAAVPEHAHGAQWGIVISGELELTIGGALRTYRKGDTYEIPAGTPHSAACPGGALVLDLFADPSRYGPRTPSPSQPPP
ncbi:MAG: cupin domain-containing protein [Deferrisomatales bacterium]|nr:cupin domain-containing protein [Deferrisomatales bacterium]